MKKTVTAHVYLGRGMTISGDLLTPGTAPVLRGPTDAAPVSARALSVARTSGRASPPVTSSTPRMDPSIFHVASSLCRLPLAVWDSAVRTTKARENEVKAAVKRGGKELRQANVAWICVHFFSQYLNQ